MATIIIITYDDNVAGPAFTGRAAKSNQPISPACQAHSSKPTAAALLSWSHAGTDVRTDARQMHRPRSAYYAGSADYAVLTCAAGPASARW